MTQFWKTDTEALVRDLGVAVVVGATTAYGLLDAMAVPMDDGTGTGNLILVKETSVLMATSQLPGGLVVGATCTVDGTTYRVRELRTEDDGAMTRVLLAKVTA